LNPFTFTFRKLLMLFDLFTTLGESPSPACARSVIHERSTRIGRTLTSACILTYSVETYCNDPRRLDDEPGGAESPGSVLVSKSCAEFAPATSDHS
jgi:hypothetical protein